MNRKIDLNESLNSAIEKMENAKKAYEWLKRNEETSNTQEQTEKFDIFKEISTVPDILLRCFVIEKGIPCYQIPPGRKDGSTQVHPKEVAIQNLEAKAYAYNLCRSILYYNAQNPDKTYLQDVDFTSFFDESKEVRNLNTHAGVRGVLQDAYRIFVNLNKILLSLDCNQEHKTVLPDERPERERFDFERFRLCMENMNTDERIFVLISDSLHDIDREELSSFLSIPWSLIIDFDGTSNYGGLLSAMTAANIPYNSYLEEEFTTNNTIPYIPGRVMHVSLCNDNDFREQFRAQKKSPPGERDRIANAVNKIRNTRVYCTVVVDGVQNDRMKSIINNITEQFKETDVIYLVRQNGGLVEKTDDDEWSDMGNISSVTAFGHSIYKVMERIHANRDALPKREYILKSDTDVIYSIRVPGGSKIGIRDRDQIQKAEQYFEFVHWDIGQEVTEVNKWAFFHGDSVSWATLRYGDIPMLSDKAEDFIKRMRKGRSNVCYYLYHSPGIGGSTLGRQIGWKLSREMPVLITKRYHSSQSFETCLRNVYLYLFEKNPFMILVDENEFSDKEMQEIEKIVSNTDYRVSALFIKRIGEEDAIRRSKEQDERWLLFTGIETDERKLLESACYTILQGKNQESKYKDRLDELEKTIDEKQQYALLINLYLLEEDFKLETYVGRFLKELPEDADGTRMKDLLAFTAMGAYYSNNVKIPVSYYSQYLSFVKRKDYINDRKQRSSVEKMFKGYEEGLLLKVYDQGNKLYGIKHYLIAQEMLKQLLGGNGSWRSSLREYSCKLIDMLASLSKGRSEIDEEVRNVITALFTDKTRDREQRPDRDFTALLEEMDEPVKIDIILYLADCFGKIINENIPKKQNKPEYELLAHIYAQCAKIRSKCLRIDEDEISESEVDQWIAETNNLIVEEQIEKYDLEDMLGRCYLDRIKRADHIELNEENTRNLLKNVDEAITHFDNTVKYGSVNYGLPGKLESLWRGIKIIISRNGWGEEQLIEHLNKDEKAREYLEMGNETIREADGCEMTSLGRVRMLKEQENFEQTCYPMGFSSLIGNLINLQKTLDPQDYAGQYMISSSMVHGYERKYSQRSKEYRRSQLIYEALRGNRDAKEDAKRVFDQLDLMVKLSSTHMVSYTTYKCWFEYAKYLEISFGRAWDVAMLWKSQELERNRNNIHYESNLLLPYYYLYVITLLKYMSGQGMTTESNVRERKEDLVAQIKATRTSRSTSAVRDWLATRKGMGQLYDGSWINLTDVDAEPMIRVVGGEVVHYENNQGYLKLVNPRALGSWGKPPVGQRYSKDCDVFFDGRQSGVVSELDVGNRQIKEFKVGFSFEKMVASIKSLEQNIKKTIVEETVDQETFKEEHVLKENCNLNPKTPADSENRVRSLEECDFFPEAIGWSKTGEYMYLNGTLSNGMRGGLSSSDIDLFKNVSSSFGNSEDILYMLKEIPSFRVKIMDSRNPERCRLSLFHTGIELDEIIGRKEEAGKEEPVLAVDETDKIPKADSLALPDISGKVTLYNCDYSKKNSISGIFEYEGKKYQGMIIRVSGKTLQDCKKRSRIEAKVISKDQHKYILQI